MQVLNINDETGEIEFEITEEEQKLLQKLCYEHNMSIEEMLSKIIDDYVNREDKDNEND